MAVKDAATEKKRDDLFMKIALENKLVTKFQVKKAQEEQDRLAEEEGKRPALGKTMVVLGFLTDKQLESVKIAQKYREQRNADKRIARQVLRMALLDKAKVDECLELQKKDYGKGGNVKSLAEILQARKLLTSAQLGEVKRAIELRDTQGTTTIRMNKADLAARAKAAAGEAVIEEDDDEADALPQLDVLEEVPSEDKKVDELVPDDELEVVDNTDEDEAALAALRDDDEDELAELDEPEEAGKGKKGEKGKKTGESSSDEKELATELAALDDDGSDVALDKDEEQALREEEEEPEDEEDEGKGGKGAWAEAAFEEKPKPAPPKASAPAPSGVSSRPTIGAGGGGASPSPRIEPAKAQKPPEKKPEPAKASAPEPAKDSLAIPGGELVGAFDSSHEETGASEAGKIPGSELLDEIPAPAPKGKPDDAVERLAWRSDPSSEEKAPQKIAGMVSSRPLPSRLVGGSKPAAAAPAPAPAPAAPPAKAPEPAKASAPSPVLTPAPAKPALDEAKLRRAFDRAVESAWKTLLEEIRKDA